MAHEATESALEEGQELRSRVEDLESQLDDLQRLLQLKSDQLAKMQAWLNTGSTDEPLEEVIQTVINAVGEDA